MAKLFTNFVADQTTKAAGFAPQPFAYTPPTNCPGPWAKVIIVGDFSVEAGSQLDNTTDIYIGATILLYGSAMEPSPNLGRSWHVERDVTDYSSLLSHSQPGQVTLQSYVTASNPSRIFASGYIQFYPTSASAHAPITPDVVLPISADPILGEQIFVTGADTVTRTFTMPTNVERVYLDIIARNAVADEFDYLCVPDSTIATALQTCGGTSFREVEISIDGKPAGVAPAFPRITQGSIDPFLWRPIPPVIALNFLPYRVDLTPFAGPLSDGHPHTVAIRVVDAQFFGIQGAVLLYLDGGTSQVTGALEINTLRDPSPVSTEKLTTKNGTTTGTITVHAARDFRIKGYVNTSHGQVSTEIAQNVEFQNKQNIKIANGGNLFVQDVNQTTTVRSVTTTLGKNGADAVVLQTTEFPIEVDISSTVGSTGSLTQKSSVHEEHNQSEASATEGHEPFFWSVSKNSVEAADTIFFSPSFSILGNEGQSSSQTVLTKDSRGNCYDRTIVASDGLLKKIVNAGCDDDDDKHSWQ